MQGQKKVNEDAVADIIKTICQPPPYRGWGVDITNELLLENEGCCV